MRFLKNRTVLGVLCIVLSLIICFAVTPLFNKAMSEKTEIVRVVKPISVGEEITSDMVKTIEVGSYNLPDDVVKHSDTVVGAFASADLAPGDYIMTSKIGIFRRGAEMESAVSELEDLYKRSFKVSCKSQLGANAELTYAYRTQKMLRLALTVACGAAARTESRGAHFREDYPVRDDSKWLKRTLASWNDGDTLPTLSYEDLDVKKMELPPGWRGYGAKNYIDHPDTAKRQAEVDEIRAKMEAEGADRFAIQNALMPYAHLLPKRLQGKNERIDEPLA